MLVFQYRWTGGGTLLDRGGGHLQFSYCILSKLRQTETLLTVLFRLSYMPVKMVYPLFGFIHCGRRPGGGTKKPDKSGYFWSTEWFWSHIRSKRRVTFLLSQPMVTVQSVDRIKLCWLSSWIRKYFKQWKKTVTGGGGDISMSWFVTFITSTALGGELWYFNTLLYTHVRFVSVNLNDLSLVFMNSW